MISKYKKVNIKGIVIGAIIVVILGGLGIVLIASNIRSNKNIAKATAAQVEIPRAFAKEFGKNLYTVDGQKIADYKKFLVAGENLNVRDSIGPGGIIKADKVAEAEYFKIMQSLDKDIQPLMTPQAYDGIVGNRWSNLSVAICSKGNYTCQVTDITLEKNLYADNTDKAGYYYQVKLKFTSTDGKAERADVSKGYIALLKTSGKWKVSIYELKEAPKLYDEMMKNAKP